MIRRILIPTDSMNYQIVTGATGTSLKISFISVWGNATPAPGGGGSPYQHFRNTTKPMGRQDWKSDGRLWIKLDKTVVQSESSDVTPT